MKWLWIIPFVFSHSLCGFDLNNLYTDIPSGSEPTVQLMDILSQPFSYLGEGAQVYAFLSDDQTTVLKLFKARHRTPFKISRFFSRLAQTDEEKKRKQQKWGQKFQETCRRYKWALLDLKEETGLIYLHFEKTPIPLPVTILGKKSQQVDLSKYPFILQKKAVLAPEYFRKHPEKKSSATAALKALFVTRLQKGYTDARQSLSVNYGFIEDRPVQIDVGKIEPFAGEASEELKKIHAHIDAWVSKR